ncbi:MAG: hypothetical protein WB919_19805 [Candidatus Sulfotelmatobacter sp.]
MTRQTTIFARMLLLLLMVGCCDAAGAQALANGYERSFPQSKATIEKILQDMQPATAGRLPVLDGFAISNSADHPLDRYKRGYYQSRIQVSAAPSGGSIVRVSVEVTAWYADPVGSKSGYQLLPSNGRLEGDLLDQLGDELASNAPHAAPTRAPSPASSAPVVAAVKPPKSAVAAAPSASCTEPTISAPVPRLPEVRSDYSGSLAQGLAAQQAGAQGGPKKTDSLDNQDGGPLQTEINNLEEILKNQAHPKNLVAVKKSGTPVVASASLTAKTLFLASAHDEFEMLDFNRDWVHVRISGLSRGWIWRNNLEMPESVPNTDAQPSAVPTAAELFHISREEVALFPGNWKPLLEKNVKIVSVEKNDDNGKDSGPQLRLEFVKSILERDYPELAQKPKELAGIVIIFDSADGGMIAATFATLQQWKAGSLSDAALWHQCFFDPPETFTQSGASASQ